MKDVQLAFKDGKTFKLKLLEKEAPETVQAFLKVLPLEVKLLHARFAGEGIFFTADMDEVKGENQVVAKEQGTLTLHGPAPSGLQGQAIHLWYGTNFSSKHAESLFARVEGDLKEFATIGERVWKEGPETVRVEII